MALQRVSDMRTVLSIRDDAHEPVGTGKDLRGRGEVWSIHRVKRSVDDDGAERE